MERTAPAILFLSSIFLITQVTGLLLALGIRFILQDYSMGFIRLALINSLLLGLALSGTCYLTGRLMSRMKVRYISLVTFSIVLGTGIIGFFTVLFTEPVVFLYYDRGAFAFLGVNFLFIMALHIISTGFIVNREKILQKEIQIRDERNLKNEMELKLLASRVNPHFLFNTLNMILNLLKQPDKAETALLNLSDLLRENLEQSEKPAIPVSRELENVRKYLQIQNLRFGERLTFTVSGNGRFPIPPLVIQPLVENSIKHNIKDTDRLDITVTVTSGEKGNLIRISDSEKRVIPAMLDKGAGLTITKKRVENAGGEFTIKDGGIELWFRN